MTSHVLMAGCGDLGTAVGLRLLRRGWAVTGLRRQPSASGALATLRLDLADPADMRLPSTDVVVMSLTADGRTAADYERTYRQGLRGLRRTLGDQQPRLVFVSSTSVIGPYDGQRVTEETPPAPSTETSEVLLAAEQDARDLFEHVVVIRPAGIYGPGRTRTIERIRRGDPVDHMLMTNRIHRDDLAEILVTLVESTDPPELLHATDGAPARQAEVAAFIAERLGVPTPPDNGDGSPRGKTIDASALRSLPTNPPLRYPSFREGYAELISSAAQDSDG
ncbi:NAD-dependent epimerase/dehydratase family protein [Nesterenkonia lacusekhoensis]|uniref:Nucleoside-diphosphate-sugar epimerase n=1 Tax=Nesterenkonia lacusekhoensis TaxID=150832 RepID=A0ABS4T464_9MICC|nr:NAD-dependent epimerase/dehydratase family protein [Nesterenkonia lacusekhoensis]MBP2318086.1 nucleoside-diphosphate-sugar epimerase [Nesterenkonia lacusekhoensis]